MAASGEIVWPEKTREMRNHHLDSTIWNAFRFRGDDIVIASYGKSGTTWTQQIVAQMLFGPDPGLEAATAAPWIELRFAPAEERLRAAEAQSRRRVLKTHLPVDALVFSPRAKYIYVARDGRDVVWSLHNHHAGANARWYAAVNDTPGRVGPPIGPPPGDIRRYFRDWLERDGHPFWPFWANVRTWWAVRGLPNVLLVHFADLKRDLSGEARRIASFLGIAVGEGGWGEILEYSSFRWMRRNAAKSAPLGGAFWKAGARGFIHKGVKGRWAGTLTPGDVADYESRAVRELGPECARWLACGGFAGEGPSARAFRHGVACGVAGGGGRGHSG